MNDRDSNPEVALVQLTVKNFYLLKVCNNYFSVKIIFIHQRKSLVNHKSSPFFPGQKSNDPVDPPVNSENVPATGCGLLRSPR